MRCQILLAGADRGQEARLQTTATHRDAAAAAAAAATGQREEEGKGEKTL